MSRLSETFRRLRAGGGCGFVPFIMAGDPDIEHTERLIVELACAGATVIELGVPFSDPVADGVVIQRAAERALQSEVNLAGVLKLVGRVRLATNVPLVIFSYFNPLLQFGLERFAVEASRTGVDGVLVTDLALEEAGEFAHTLAAHDLDMIFLVAPTSTDARLRMIAERASGFIYAVSRTGVTGARETLSREAEQLVRRVRAVCDLPIVVGFGISTREQVMEVCRFADAAVVGSAIVEEIERLTSDGKAPGDFVERVGVFARALLS